jgi:hypothetical protein
MKLSARGRASIFGALLLFVLAFSYFVPVVPFAASVSIPRNFGDEAYHVCEPLAQNTTAFQTCLGQNSLPAVPVRGYAPLAYWALGHGAGPYPYAALVNQGNESALVYFEGSSIAMAEALPTQFYIPTGEQPVLLQPGSLQVSNVKLTPASNGLIQFSATIMGTTLTPIAEYGYSDLVYFDYPGYGSNSTADGVTWHTPLTYIPCSIGANGACQVTRTIAPRSDLQANETYPMTVVVYGYTFEGFENATEVGSVSQGQTTIIFQTARVKPFVYVQTLGVTYPGSGPDGAWVNEFISLVNGHRGSTPLVEDSSLDSFAYLRFGTAVANYTISDYGFAKQSAAYFAGTGRISNEELLYPSTFGPAAYVTYLQEVAPTHWGILTDTTYAKFGYYIGTGPAVEVSDTCPVREATQPNVNITQMAIENHCSYKVDIETWLVIELSS